jgi:hypothetical protein
MHNGLAVANAEQSAGRPATKHDYLFSIVAACQNLIKKSGRELSAFGIHEFVNHSDGFGSAP